MAGNREITFGQYKGYSWAFVVNLDPDYIVWAKQNVRYANIPDEIYKAAWKVRDMRSRVDRYDGHRLTPHWNHPDYIH